MIQRFLLGAGAGFVTWLAAPLAVGFAFGLVVVAGGPALPFAEIPNISKGLALVATLYFWLGFHN